MGNWISSESGPQISEDRVAQIQTETGFTSPQIDRLWKRFQELDRGQKNYLTREDFLNLPDLGINPVSLNLYFDILLTGSNNQFRDYES